MDRVGPKANSTPGEGCRTGADSTVREWGAPPVPVPPRPTAPIKTGDMLLGTYAVVADPIESSMGRVVRVRHTGWRIDLAVKLPRRDLIPTESDRERFMQEARTWIDLGPHPHIVTCRYVREIDGVPAIFSDWVDGGTLRDWIARTHRGLESLPPQPLLEEIICLAIQVARGLSWANSLGVIHRDVKPSNILLSPSGRAKITDFGVATAWGVDSWSPERLASLSPDDMKNLCGDGEPRVFGTTAYRSPEQSHGDPATQAMDLAQGIGQAAEPSELSVQPAPASGPGRRRPPVGGTWRCPVPLDGAGDRRHGGGATAGQVFRPRG